MAPPLPTTTSNSRHCSSSQQQQQQQQQQQPRQFENLNPQRPYQLLTRKQPPMLSLVGGTSSSSVAGSRSSSSSSSSSTAAGGGQTVIAPPKKSTIHHRPSSADDEGMSILNTEGGDGVVVGHHRKLTTGIERSHANITSALSSLGGKVRTSFDGGTVSVGSRAATRNSKRATARGSSRRKFENSNTTTTMISSSVIGEHLRSISASLSYDEYERLRDESRALKVQHDERYNNSQHRRRSSSLERLLPITTTSGRELLLNDNNNDNDAYDDDDDENSNTNSNNNNLNTTLKTTNTTMAGGVDAVATKTKPALVEYMQSTASTAVITNLHQHRRQDQQQQRRVVRMSDVSAEVDRCCDGQVVVYNGGGDTAGVNNGMVQPIRKDKTVVEMTTDGLHKIQTILGGVTQSKDEDEMSFFCTTSNDGHVVKQKLSLGGGGGDSGNDDNNKEEEFKPQSSPPRGQHRTTTRDIGSLLHHATKNAVDDIGPKLHHATKKVYKATRNSLGEVAQITHDNAPIVGAGLVHVAKNVVKTARHGVEGVSELTKQSLEGAGALAVDMAANVAATAATHNAKTPARSNVTGGVQQHQLERRRVVVNGGGGEGYYYYPDYVNDTNYQVVTTPVNADVEHVIETLDGPYGNYCNPCAPPCLAGAIVAGRCDLSPSNPESLEYLPGGIPRVLIVYDDWEERAGFIPTAGTTNTTKVTLKPKMSNLVANNMAVVAMSDGPIDVDEETATINGEEINVEEMWALRQGRETPTNASLAANAAAAAQKDRDNDRKSFFNQHNENLALAQIVREGIQQEQQQHVNEEETSASGSSGGNILNASMWVAVPDNYEEEDAPDDYLDETMCVNHIRMGEFLDDDSESEDDDDDTTKNVGDIYMGDLLTEEDMIRNRAGAVVSTPLSTDGDTFFVGDVHLGFESPSSLAPVVEDASSEDDDDNDRHVKAANSWSPEVGHPMTGASKASGVVRAMKNGVKSHSSFQDDESLASFAKNITNAVIHDKQQQQQHFQTKAKEFVTPHSVKKGERPLTFTEFKTMNRQVLFNMEDGDKVYQWEGPDDANAHRRHPRPSAKARELSPREPGPVRSINGIGHHDYAAAGKSTTDLSLYSNWAVPPKTVKDSTDSSGKRQLKGRVILVKITKKISKVAKKVLFNFGKKRTSNIDESEIKDGNGFIISLPKSNPTDYAISTDYAIPCSPSAYSVSSSIMTGSGTKRIIGATRPEIGSPIPGQQYLYGTVNYGNRGSSPDNSSNSADRYDSLPAPPEHMPQPTRREGRDSEDAVSYLAEALRRVATIDDDDEENSVLLLVTPKDDGTGEDYQVVDSSDATPAQIHQIIDALAESNHTATITSGVKPNNLSCPFTDENGANATIEIMNAVDCGDGSGGVVLTPYSVSKKNQNVARVFRTSTGGESASLLPGSEICDSEDEDETLCYHDGCTVIHQTSTFGDHTISTHSSSLATSKNVEGAPVVRMLSKTTGTKQTTTPVINNGMDIGTPILSPDGLPLSRQAAENGSFLFSPNNMGRADPIIRAKERAASMKSETTKPSITMLPSVKTSKMVSVADHEVDINNLLVIQKSNSHSTIETSEELNEIQAFVAKKKQQIMSTMTNDRQFPFRTIVNNKSSADASLNRQQFNDDDDSTVKTSTTAPASPPLSTAIRKTYPKTPFPEAKCKSIASSEESSPALIVAVNNVSSTSPSNMSIYSSTSSKCVSIRSKRSPPQDKKTVPKSALKTRKGFVKDRVTDIQQRIGVPTEGSALHSSMNGSFRLKRNHSYRLKKERRTTNGNGALAPQKAVLKPTYIRSVPIAIAKSYSRDSKEGEVVTATSVDDVKEVTNFAAKYTSAGLTVGKPVDRSSLDSIKADEPSSDASYVSETTDCDPFSSLLGKLSSDDDDSSASEDDEEGGEEQRDDSDKENMNSPSNHLLPFKVSTLVKPTEINLREESLPSPVPPHARAWREMAVKAALEKGQSARFRSEKSWQKLAVKSP